MRRVVRYKSHAKAALRVLILDNDSPDVSAASRHDHVWWLWLDADEFVHGPGGETVRAIVTSLDRRFRIVGTRYFNHYPDRRPEYLPGWHPLDVQPLGEERLGNLCALGHRKHNLQRWDHAGPPITRGLGFHAARCAETLVEPTAATFTHHFPYRLEEVTRRRLDALWANVENLERDGTRVGVAPQPWTSAVEPRDAHVDRWYRPAELEEAVAAWRDAAGASR